MKGALVISIAALPAWTVAACGGTATSSTASYDAGDSSSTGAASGSSSGASGTVASKCVDTCCPKPGQTTAPASTDSGQCAVTIDLAGPASACGLEAGVVLDGFCDNLCPLPSAPMYLLGCSVYADTSGAHAICQYGGPCGK
jgi:hypothetical protein